MAVLAVYLLPHFTDLGRMLELQAAHGESRGGRSCALIEGVGPYWRPYVYPYTYPYPTPAQVYAQPALP
jgi:hypothetical protein